MGRKKKKETKKYLKILYFIAIVIVVIAGIYFENGYTNINDFINDALKEVNDVNSTIYSNVKETLTEENNENVEPKKKKAKVVNGSMEMHTIDVGQRR